VSFFGIIVQLKESPTRENIEHWAKFQSDGAGLEKRRIFSEVRIGNRRKKEFSSLSW
jgi:hypothetical protein